MIARSLIPFVFKEIDYPYVSFTATPLPGTQLYQDCRNHGLITNDEEYLMQLDSGYNLIKPLVNLTHFSDEEFVCKKRKMQIKITHNYLILGTLGLYQIPL